MDLPQTVSTCQGVNTCYFSFRKSKQSVLCSTRSVPSLICLKFRLRTGEKGLRSVQPTRDDGVDGVDGPTHRAIWVMLLKSQWGMNKGFDHLSICNHQSLFYFSLERIMPNMWCMFGSC